MIPRKWEWIRAQCLKRRFEAAAELAGEIDDALLDCYDGQHTPRWTFFCRENDMDALVSRGEFIDIVTNPGFCIACVERHTHSGDGHSRCVGCRFGEMCGDCGDQDSLYKRFLREIEKKWLYRLKAMIRGEEGINGE